MSKRRLLPGTLCNMLAREVKYFVCGETAGGPALTSGHRPGGPAVAAGTGAHARDGLGAQRPEHRLPVADRERQGGALARRRRRDRRRARGPGRVALSRYGDPAAGGPGGRATAVRTRRRDRKSVG